MNFKSVLITGSSGIIGWEVCAYFSAQGWAVHGVDTAYSTFMKYTEV